MDPNFLKNAMKELTGSEMLTEKAVLIALPPQIRDKFTELANALIEDNVARAREAQIDCPLDFSSNLPVAAMLTMRPGASSNSTSSEIDTIIGMIYLLAEFRTKEENKREIELLRARINELERIQ